ncbi:LOW QUALITY PROTEIN: hypothetical protein HID58_002353, partial [Brassica napus]
QEKSLGLEDDEGPRLGDRDPGPRGKNPDPGGRDLEEGSWSNLFMEYFSPTYQAALLIVLRCTCARCERICCLVGDDLVNALRVDIIVVRDQVGPDFLLLLYKDEILPLRWGFAGVGRMFYEEARNTCIKGDTSAHTQVLVLLLWLYSPDFSLRFLRLSGSTKRVEECMGQDPGILRGRILARLRTMGMSRFSKSRRPKLRILMLDSTGLACASRASKGSVASYLVSGSYFDFWQRGHSAWNPEDPRHALPKSGGLEIHLSIDRRLYRLSSCNLEAGWTLIKEPVACMDLSPGTLRIFVREPDGCVDLQGDLPVYLFDSKSSSSGRLSLIASFLEQCLPLCRPAILLEGLKTEQDVLDSTWRRVIFQMVDRGLDEYFQVLDLFEGDLVSSIDVGFGGDGLADASVSFDIRQLDTWSLDLTLEEWRSLFRHGCYFSWRTSRFILESLEAPWNYNFFWLLSAPSWTGVFLTPSLRIPVSYNFSRDAALETWRGMDPEFPREFVGGCREAVFPALGQGSFRGTTTMEVDEY